MGKVGWTVRRLRGSDRMFLLSIALAIFLVPVLWTLLASLGVVPDDLQTPPSWTWPPTFGNYVEIGATTPDFANSLLTSTGVAAAATALTIVVSFLATFALVHWQASGTRALVQGFLILASIPAMAFVIPLSDTVHRLGLYDTLAGVTLADTALLAPLAIYVLYGYMKQVPADLEESARIDGASVPQIIWNIFLPATFSGVAATAIIVFVLNWNLLLVPLVLTENHVKTLPVLMTDFFILEREIEWPPAAAVLIASLVPLLLLVAVAHRAAERFTLTA